MSDKNENPLRRYVAGKITERLRQGAAPKKAPAAMPESPECTVDRCIDLRRLTVWIHEESVRDWTGAVKIRGAIESDGVVQWADDLGVEPDFYTLYARKTDNSMQWLSNCHTERQARQVAQHIAEVFSLMRGE
jgi:hypothetical protein